MQSESLTTSIAPIVGGCESRRAGVDGECDLGGMSLELLALSDSELSEEEKRVRKICASSRKRPQSNYSHS